MKWNRKKWPLNSIILSSISLITVLGYVIISLYIVFADLSTGKIFYFKSLFGALAPASFATFLIFGRNDLRRVSPLVHIVIIAVALPFIYFAKDLPKILADLRYYNSPQETVLTDTVIRSRYVKSDFIIKPRKSLKYLFDGIDENDKQQLFYFRFGQTFWRKIVFCEKIESSDRIKEEVVKIGDSYHGTFKNPVRIRYLPNSRIIVEVAIR